MISHASKDENGKYSNGIAGDQGNEVAIRSWYNRPWGHVIRCNDSKMRNKIADAMEAAAKNEHIGYDQSQRNTLLAFARPYRYNPAMVSVDCECDCSSLVSVACMYAGVPEIVLYQYNNCATTSTIRKRLESTGLFTVLTDSKYLTSEDYLLRGDILLSESHHVACNLTDGKYSSTTPSIEKISVGIDISKYNTITDYSKVKSAGVDFAFIKVIDKSRNKEPMFETHYQGCVNAGINIEGFYCYTYSTTTDMAVKDAEAVIQALNGRKGIIVYDVEDKCLIGLNSAIIDVIWAFKEYVEMRGYQFLLYTGVSFFNSNIKPFLGTRQLPAWIARYPRGSETGAYLPEYKPDIPNMYYWQYTSSGNIPGINGKVDMNVKYLNIPTFSVQPTTQSKETPILVIGQTTANLNVRQSPNTNSSILRTIKKGDFVQLIGDLDGWYKVQPHGYVSKDYIKQVHGKVTANKLNLRSTADSSIDSNKIDILLKDEIVTICLASGEWYHVLTNKGVTGWVSGKYITLWE